ncbi:MAG: VOC family protein [Chloroflexota bacterium]
MSSVDQKIVPHLWFDKEARQAAEFYTSIFPHSRIKSTAVLNDTPSGSVETVTFDLFGQAFSAISAGPLFKFNPSISFQVACETDAEVDACWARLSEGGQALMELGEYPFSQRFGWVQDRYGLSWQVMHMGSRPIRNKIIPMLMFVGEQVGKAEDAIQFYVSVFPDSHVDEVLRHGAGAEPDKPGTLQQASFTLAGQAFSAIDSAYEHGFTFNEAISLMVYCDTQAEIDDYWGKLSAVPEAEQCGWLKDRYGVSWQIVPTRMDEMMRSSSPEQLARVTEAFLAMKKFDLAQLEMAYAGR